MTLEHKSNAKIKQIIYFLEVVTLFIIAGSEDFNDTYKLCIYVHLVVLCVAQPVIEIT